MCERPSLDTNLDSIVFKEYYYLKEELIDFCRKNNLQTTGGKLELTERIAQFLDTGEKIYKNHTPRKSIVIDEITLDAIIEENFVCSEKHREFYKNQIGKSFSFNVPFQNWLKNNSGKTYRDSIIAYDQILQNKKKNKTTIDKQFEYNTYIRDFFHDNKNKSLQQAIQCWKYKKSLKGHNRYEKKDLKALNQGGLYKIKYIALLRGINISGKNKISMEELKKEFEQLGYKNVITYHNSGNVIFISDLNDAAIIKYEIEQMIKEKFNFDIPVFIIAAQDLEELLNNYPKWWGTDNKEIYDNIIFIIPPHTFEKIYSVIGEPKKEYEKIKEYKNTVFWSYSLKDYRKTNWWSKTASTNIRDKITIRTANTMKKILEICNK